MDNREWLGYGIMGNNTEYINDFRGFLRKSGIRFEEDEGIGYTRFEVYCNKDERMKIDGFRDEQRRPKTRLLDQ